MDAKASKIKAMLDPAWGGGVERRKFLPPWMLKGGIRSGH